MESPGRGNENNNAGLGKPYWWGNNIGILGKGNVNIIPDWENHLGGEIILEY